MAFAIRSEVTTRRGKTGVALLTLAGIGAASAARFDLNQAAPHDLAGVVGIVCLPVAAMLITPALTARPAWRAGRKPMLLGEPSRGAFGVDLGQRGRLARLRVRP